MPEQLSLFKANDGEWFYSDEEAREWDEKTRAANESIKNVLQNQINKNLNISDTFNQIIKDLNPSQLRDFADDINKLHLFFKQCVFQDDSYINVDPQNIIFFEGYKPVNPNPSIAAGEKRKIREPFQDKIDNDLKWRNERRAVLKRESTIDWKIIYSEVEVDIESSN